MTQYGITFRELGGNEVGMSILAPDDTTALMAVAESFKKEGWADYEIPEEIECIDDWTPELIRGLSGAMTMLSNPLAYAIDELNELGEEGNYIYIRIINEDTNHVLFEEGYGVGEAFIDDDGVVHYPTEEK